MEKTEVSLRRVKETCAWDGVRGNGEAAGCGWMLWKAASGSAVAAEFMNVLQLGLLLPGRV